MCTRSFWVVLKPVYKHLADVSAINRSVGLTRYCRLLLTCAAG